MTFRYCDTDTPGRQEPGNHSAITKPFRATAGLMGRTKSLSPGANEAARAVVRELVVREFAGNVKAAAKAIGVSQSLLHEFLEGIRGAGMHTLEALSKYTGKPIDVIVGHAPAAMDDSALGRDVDYPARFAELEAWNSRATRPFAADVFDELPTVSFGMRRGPLTVEFLRRVCEAIVQSREDQRDHGALLFHDDPLLRKQAEPANEAPAPKKPAKGKRGKG